MEKPSKEATSIKLIEYLMGYVADGPDTTIKLSQNDATGKYYVTIIGFNRSDLYYGNDLHSALFLAVFGE